MKNFTKEEITEGLKKAYNEAGHNAYFGEGFKAGIQFSKTNQPAIEEVITMKIDFIQDKINEGLPKFAVDRLNERISKLNQAKKTIQKELIQ